MIIGKSGKIDTSFFLEKEGTNILQNEADYIQPFEITCNETSTGVMTNLFAKVTPGSTYYIKAKCSTAWGTNSQSALSYATGYIELCGYSSYTSSATSSGLLTSANKISDNLWTYKVPSGINVIKIKLWATANASSLPTKLSFRNISMIRDIYYCNNVGNGRNAIIAEDFNEI